MKLFEFQFRWGRTRYCFGIDVNAVSIEEAVTKANRFSTASMRFVGLTTPTPNAFGSL